MVDYLKEGDEVHLAGDNIGRRVIKLARGGKYVDLAPPPAIPVHVIDGVMGRWVESLLVVRMPAAVVETPPDGAWDAPA